MKLLVFVLAALTLAQIAMAGGTQEAAASKGPMEISVAFFVTKNQRPDVPNLMDKVLLEKFNVKAKWEFIDQNAWQEKINLLFTSGDYPEFLWIHDNPKGVSKTDEYGPDGLMVNLLPYLDKMPNYKAMWSPEDWAEALNYFSAPDGGLYSLPTHHFRVSQFSWLWRKSSFDKWGLKFPRTHDELYAVLQTIKKNDPKSIPVPNRGGLGGQLDTFESIFHVQDGMYKDGITGRLVKAGEATDRYREMLAYARKLYTNGMLDKEFATASIQQWTERYAKGEAYMQYTFTRRWIWAQELQQKLDPATKWEWSPELISAYPNEGYIYHRDQPFWNRGYIITKRATPEKRDKLLALLDWFASDEGVLFQNYGIEGETFTYKDGVPTLKDGITLVEETAGKMLFKFISLTDFYEMRKHPARLTGVNEAAYIDWGKVIEKRKDFKYNTAVILKPNLEQSKKLADLRAGYNSIRDEQTMKFIVGQKDPSSDADWKDYLATLEKAGLSRIVELQDQIYGAQKNK